MNLLRAEAYVRTYPHAKLADVYDDDEMLRMALSALFPDYEYPDISYMTISELWRKYEKSPQPLVSP